MFKCHCFPSTIILQAVYFKLRFGLSYRDLEELLSIRGVKVDHATIQRWVFKFTPLVNTNFRKWKHQIGTNWRMNETYIKVKGNWKYLYRAVDKSGKTIDFLLTSKRNKRAAHKFLNRAIKTYNKRNFTNIKLRQCKYLNNIVEQDHRMIKWRIQRGLGFKSFESAKRTLSGIETVRMIMKNQLKNPARSTFKSFCSLVA